MDGKKIAATVVLIVVIVAALYFVAKRVSSGTKPPPAITGQPMELISLDGGEPVTKAMSEWEAAGMQNGMYRNPATGAYDMVSAMTCFVCGKKIPNQVPPAELNTPEAGPGAVEKWRAALKCPKCGKNPFPSASGVDIMRLRGGPGMKGPGKAPGGPGKAPGGPGKAPGPGKLPAPKVK